MLPRLRKELPPLGSLPHPKFIAPISKLLRTEISSYSEISAEKGLRSESLKNGRRKAYSISEGIYGKEAIGLDAERCTRDRPRIRCIPGKPQGMTWPPRQLLPCKCCASPPHILIGIGRTSGPLRLLASGAHVPHLLSKIDEPGNGHEQRAPNALCTALKDKLHEFRNREILQRSKRLRLHSAGQWR
jgi:hypothetical protein